MAGIFISYRRTDSAAIAGRAYDRLVARYGSGSVFLDINDIPPGVDFRTHIARTIAACRTVLVFISPDWVTRIHAQDDPVRVEIEAGLATGATLIPVLIDGATMPAADALPTSIQSFAYRNAALLDNSRTFQDQLEHLFRAIDQEAAVAALPLPDKPSIAVLPFQNISGDPEQDYFADGMVEEVITALSRFRHLFVIARNSSFVYKGRAVDVKQVGRELGVRYVLEGSVRKAANRIRITGQLIDAATGSHLWADRFDGTLDDIFELQDEVASRVVGAISPTLDRAELQRSRRKPTESLDAYDCYLHGMARVWQIGSSKINDEAFDYFMRAIALDPEFAAAYAMAAYAVTQRKASGWRTNPQAETAEGLRLARRAVELGHDDAVAMGYGGLVLSHLSGDIDVGKTMVDRAFALNPYVAIASHGFGWMKIWDGQLDAAIEFFKHAIRRSPMDPYLPRMQNAMAHAYFFAGNYEEAASIASAAVRVLPDFHDALRISAASNAMAGHFAEATKAVIHLRQLDPGLRVSSLRDIQGPYRRQEDHDRYEEALRRAGIPE